MKKVLSIKRIRNAFSYAFNGIRETYISEANMRFHFIVALIVIFMGFLFKVSSLEWIILIMCICFVISAEVINTCLEKMVDLITENKNRNAKVIKDTAAAFVMIFAIASLIIGLIIFVPKIINVLGGIFNV